MEKSTRSTKTVEDVRRTNAQVQWEGTRTKVPDDKKPTEKAVVMISGIAYNEWPIHEVPTWIKKWRLEKRT